ncbi:hypothetical protein [Curvibacter phage PCA1]|nr:hypothetical protein [Curvibacter phage PCA1]
MFVLSDRIRLQAERVSKVLNGQGFTSPQN